MKKQIPLYRLSIRDLKEVANSLEKKKYEADVSAAYQGHIPQVGIILINGKIRLIQKENIQVIKEQGTIIGVRELYYKYPLAFNLEVQNGSQVFSLAKSQLIDIMNERNKSCPLYSIIEGSLNI